MALDSIARTGSPRAVEAFSTGKGVPGDLQENLEWLHRLASGSRDQMAPKVNRTQQSRDPHPQQQRAMRPEQPAHDLTPVQAHSVDTLYYSVDPGYLDELRSRLRPNLRTGVPPQGTFREEDKPHYEMWVTAKSEGDMEGAERAVTLLADLDYLLPDERQYLLVEKALHEYARGALAEAFGTLEQVKQITPDDNAVALLVDLGHARAVRTHSSRPDFKTSFEDKRRAYEHIFSTYSSYHHYVILNHMQYAWLLFEETSKDPVHTSYEDLGLEHADKALALLEQLWHNPMLADDKRVQHIMASRLLTLANALVPRLKEWKEELKESRGATVEINEKASNLTP